jgi:hypothetical protein
VASGFTSPTKEGALWIFMALKKSIAVVGFEPVNLGLNGKCTNHYSTKATNNGVATVHMIWL